MLKSRVNKFPHKVQAVREQGYKARTQAARVPRSVIPSPPRAARPGSVTLNSQVWLRHSKQTLVSASSRTTHGSFCYSGWMRGQRSARQTVVELVKLFQSKKFIPLILLILLVCTVSHRTKFDHKAHTYVFLATDSPDLRSLFVAVNSSFSNSCNTCLKFVILVPVDLASRVRNSFDLLLPDVSKNIEIDHRSLQVRRIIDLPGVHPTGTTKRKELANPFNFAAYYIPSMSKYAHLSKVIYLDTDVVVQGDLTNLAAECCLPGTAAAVVEDCTQPFRTYINLTRLEDFILLSRHGTSNWDQEFDRLTGVRNACVFNRGVVVLELENWRRMDITLQIEKWMATNSRYGDLYYHGVSQPPFLLALLGRYTLLHPTWNTRGLGRDKMTRKEFESLVSHGLRSYIDKSGYQNLQPFLVPSADEANVLHFTGNLKPWFNRRNSTSNVSICGGKFLPCSDYWWRFISDEADAYLTSEG